MPPGTTPCFRRSPEDDQHNPQLHPPVRFTTSIEKIKQGYMVTVLDEGVQCGSYIRYYDSFVQSTFYPFMSGDRWFAIYSGDYTTTRIMSLPDCQDLGGEEPDECGFCPVELFVPAYRLFSMDSGPETNKDYKILVPGDKAISSFEEAVRLEQAGLPDPLRPKSSFFNRAISDWKWTPFGFVAGCHWGDDCDWKIQFLDLSRAAEGILTRSERFGYAVLPSAMTLSQAINMDLWLPEGRNRVGVTTTTSYDLDKPGPA